MTGLDETDSAMAEIDDPGAVRADTNGPVTLLRDARVLSCRMASLLDAAKAGNDESVLDIANVRDAVDRVVVELGLHQPVRRRRRRAAGRQRASRRGR